MEDEGTLRAYVDGELEPERQAALEAHLADCAGCRDRLAELREQAEWSVGRLNSLAPVGPGEAAPSPATALARMVEMDVGAGFIPARVGADMDPGRAGRKPAQTRGQIMGRLGQMRERWVAGGWRPVVVGALALVLVVGLFSLPPVRSAAAQFLGMFRVRKFAALSLSPAQVSNLETSLESLDGVMFGEPEMLREPGPAQDVGSASEASALAGFQVRLPAVTGALGEPKLTVESGAAGRFTIDAAKVRAVLDVAGRQDLALPPGIDGAVIEVDVPAIVTASYRDSLSRLELVQAPSPTVVIPPGVNLGELAEIGLQVIGMTPEEARQISQNIDWASTLVIPVPVEFATFREVSVDGTSGLLLSSSQSRRTAEHTLLWEKDGIVYALHSVGDPAAVLEAAASME